ncbi:MAG: SatD family protein [Bacteroidota bacterium]
MSASASNHFHILMADVVGSSNLDRKKLADSLRDSVSGVNDSLQKNILSPFTITLGDEFQGLARSLQDAVKILFFLEEQRLEKGLDFKLHYVLHEGEIDTEINRETSYGMLGTGLAEARKKLTDRKRDRLRFEFSLTDVSRTVQINRLFEVVDGIVSRWKRKDFELVLVMLQNENDQDVGDRFEKDRSQIYKRRKTLMIREYLCLKEFLFTYTSLDS